MFFIFIGCPGSTLLDHTEEISNFIINGLYVVHLNFDPLGSCIFPFVLTRHRGFCSILKLKRIFIFIIFHLPGLFFSLIGWFLEIFLVIFTLKAFSPAIFLFIVAIKRTTPLSFDLFLSFSLKLNRLGRGFWRFCGVVLTEGRDFSFVERSWVIRWTLDVLRRSNSTRVLSGSKMVGFLLVVVLFFILIQIGDLHSNLILKAIVSTIYWLIKIIKAQFIKHKCL